MKFNIKTIFLTVKILYDRLTSGAYLWSKSGSYLPVLKLYISEEVYIWEILQASETPPFFFKLVMIKSE